MKQKAVFFDRDGTLIVDKHYLHDAQQIEYFPETFSTLKEIQRRGYLLFIVTNQSGIGRGIFSEKQMQEVHHKMLADFQKAQIIISDIAFCPHTPQEKCSCRKPHPKMLLELCARYKIDPTQSYMVGDKKIDAESGVNAGMQGLQISREKTSKINNLKDILSLIK